MSTQDIPTSNIGMDSLKSNPYVIRGRYITSGGQADIFLSRRIVDGITVVEKVFHSPSFHTRARKYITLRPGEKLTKPAATPIEVLREIHGALAGCKLIAQVLQFPTREIPSMCLELCNAGDLSGLIWIHLHNRVAMGESFMWHVFKSLVEALAFIHTGLRPGGPGKVTFSKKKKTLETVIWDPIVHRDIKPDNVLMAINPHDPTDFPLIKLNDFDFSTFFDPQDCIYTKGLQNWCPPEQFNTSTPHATPHSDVWATAAVIYTMANGKPPKYQKGEGPPFWHNRTESKRLGVASKRILPARYSEHLENCVLKALQPVEHRSTALELLDSVGPLADSYWMSWGRTPPFFLAEIAPLKDEELLYV